MAFLRRIFRASSPKRKEMDQQIAEVSNQTEKLTITDDGAYNPDTVPYEVATFALS